ncbi:MAG: multiheme c-type cytochrome [Deltaproteobacteria bacterium]|nr:multiheme c-type cytochrome [Deltaproteobacteria bacterium]
MKPTAQRPFHDPRLIVAAAFLAAVFSLGLTGLAKAQESVRIPGPGLDIGAVQGPNACAECHKKTAQVWKRTVHHRVIKETHRSKEARAFAKSLRVRRIKDPKALCATCHYTVQKGKKRPKAIAGISCESCHGAARDWIKVHGEFSGKKKETESPEEAAARWTQSEKAGMIRPRNLYKLARNCYSCHATGHEDLINVGGHPSGGQFELLSWTMGEVRHNVWYTPANDEASPARKRMLYLAGLSLSLETSLKALSEARKADGMYAADLRVRIGRAKAGLAKAAERLAGVVELKAMVDAVPAPGAAAAQLEASAAAVSEQARRLLERDGGGMEALDGMLPGTGDYVGKVAKP